MILKPTTLISIFFLLLISCSKEKIEKGYVSFQYSGDTYISSYSSRLDASYTRPGGVHSLKISAHESDNISARKFSFSIEQSSEITPATYSEAPGGTATISMVAAAPASSFFGIPISASAHSNFGSTTDAVTITITEISNKYIRGTFKGQLRDNTGSTVSLKSISNGTFLAYF